MSARARIWLITGALAMLAPTSASAAVGPVSVSPDVQVTTRDPSQTVQNFNSPAIAINPGNPRQVVAAVRYDTPAVLLNCQVYFSSNGGSTWAKSTLPLPNRCWSPAVAFAKDGQVYVTAENRPAPSAGVPPGILVWSSGDGGATFGAPVTVPGSAVPRPDGSCCRSVFSPAIAADNGSSATSHPGRVYVTWEAPAAAPTGGTEDSPLSYSDDHGQTWSTPPVHSSPVVDKQRPQIPSPAVGPDGSVYIVFKDSGNTLPFPPFPPPPPGPNECLGVGFSDPGLTYQKSCPIGVVRWTPAPGSTGFDGPPVTVANAFFLDLAVAEQPSIAVAPPSTGAPNGTVLVTFATRLQDTAVPAGCQNVLRAVQYRSVDRGQTWLGPVRLSDDNACASDRTQREPWVSVAPNGRIDAIFYDNRNDPNKGDAQFLYDVYYANSTDGGVTFGPNTRLTPSSFDATTMFTANQTGFQYKEYDQVSGMDSTNAGAVAAWTDPRNDTSGLGISDVFSSTIGVPVPVLPGGPTQVPGGAAQVPPATTPTVSQYGIANKTFVVGSAPTPPFASAAATAKHKRGTIFRYTLSEAATARIVIAQRAAGRRKGTRCLAPSRKQSRAKRCTRTLTRGTLTRTSHSGVNSVAFSGRIGSKALKPGRYQATLTATNTAGRSSSAQTVNFTIVKR